MPDRPLRILAVCTGNICRSPAAELLLAHHLGGSGIEFTSAGTGAVVGAGISQTVGALLEQRGIDPWGHRARSLTAADVSAATIVLGLTREHRAAAVALAPAVLRRAFTLREFARIGDRVATELSEELGRVGEDPAGRLHLLAASAPHFRSIGEDDIDDPWHRGRATNVRVVNEIDTAVSAILGVLRPGATAGSR